MTRMYDDVATLISYTVPTVDSYGNGVPVATTRDVYVQPRSIYASEFYSAAQAGLHPSLALYMANRMDYEGEKFLEYHEKYFAVVRVDWKAQRDGLTLICEERVNSAG